MKEETGDQTEPVSRVLTLITQMIARQREMREVYEYSTNAGTNATAGWMGVMFDASLSHDGTEGRAKLYFTVKFHTQIIAHNSD